METDNTITTKVDSLKKRMDEYEVKVGLYGLTYNPQIESCIGLSWEQINLMSAEELGEKAYLLSNYALFLQCESNKQQAKLNWAETCLSYIIGKEYNNYSDKIYKYEVKRAMIIAGNTAAFEYSKIIVECQTKLTQIQFLSRNVQDIVKCLSELQITKRTKVTH